MYEYYSLDVITATAMCDFYHIVNIARPLLQCLYCCYHYGVLIAATVCNAVVSVNVISSVQRLTSCHCCGIKVIVTVWNTAAAADTCKCCLFCLNVATASCKFFHCYLICIRYCM